MNEHCQLASTPDGTASFPYVMPTPCLRRRKVGENLDYIYQTNFLMYIFLMSSNILFLLFLRTLLTRIVKRREQTSCKRLPIRTQSCVNANERREILSANSRDQEAALLKKRFIMLFSSSHETVSSFRKHVKFLAIIQLCISRDMIRLICTYIKLMRFWYNANEHLLHLVPYKFKFDQSATSFFLNILYFYIYKVCIHSIL